jgi:Ataxin 2 SM domain
MLKKSWILKSCSIINTNLKSEFFFLFLFFASGSGFTNLGPNFSRLKTSVVDQVPVFGFKFCYRFTHALTALIGNVMRVETQNYSEYEGIFKTFSAKCEMVLELAHKVSSMKSLKFCWHWPICKLLSLSVRKSIPKKYRF